MLCRQSLVSTNHNKEIWRLLKGILRYLKNEVFEISYHFKNHSKEDEFQVTVWSDASFSDDINTRKSTIGHFVFWNGYTIAWSSSKTKSVALSTTESEFISATQALRTALYMKNVNQEMFLYRFSLSLLEDNQSCIEWLKNATGYHAKTKHVDICYHFARELYAENLLDIIYVPTAKQFADLLTKSLSVVSHKTMMKNISSFSSSGGMLDDTSRLELDKAASR